MSKKLIVTKKIDKFKKLSILFLGLFTSITTVFCCALPIILVTIGMGSAFAELTNNIKIINIFIINSDYLFLISLIFIVLGGYFIFIKPKSCREDKNLAKICSKTKKFNIIIYWSSVTILSISFFLKYIIIMFL